ncbi:GFA family protein [Tabrizicola sp. J26]|uniref:GFA family protein n=1 Tax=Alitabrizicola rongguiensis TaxID=2909234 RepID=UPI001F1BDC63|nr:GFA family protein [Tabrizicola rongguiensis]MCF1707343.1 GFA family protein [Tabrizicola rongguiensis]
MSSDTTGRCLCGAVSYVAKGPVVNSRVCHCHLCQRAIGAAFNARLLFRRGDVEITGPVAEHPSSDAILRGFCPRCGTTIYSYRAAANVIGLTSGSLDDPSLFVPEAHIFVESRQPWVVLDPSVPAYPGAAPA